MTEAIRISERRGLPNRAWYVGVRRGNVVLDHASYEAGATHSEHPKRHKKKKWTTEESHQTGEGN